MYWLPNLPTLRSCSLPKVTLLGPRTPHQPEKLQKLSKNNCVLHLLFFGSIEKANLYVLWIQSSAGRAQGHAAETVQRRCHLGALGVAEVIIFVGFPLIPSAIVPLAAFAYL